ncbi:uracil transport protein [Gonapodya prolifera JEL478]|uniref:Uracil transport protein n=1 Tax=Gonapodya prolifera (strain JEL478) TaxID=1344416 RepID=A0A139B0A4_GONPJ|nr:uracil transport protein [Gonapodya prolifera JEL478]|eukprot:KXS22370.1 uracil transport protein [Gonapodya prolifera JEL478]
MRDPVKIVTSYFPRWRPNFVAGAIVAPDEYPRPYEILLLACQHFLAMFGATVLVPLLLGISTNTALLMSGIGTIVFFLITGGRIPSYLGSSFAFLGPLTSNPLAAGTGPNPNLAPALGGIVVMGLIYIAVSLIVIVAGHTWIEFLLPPACTGGIVLMIGLALAGSAVNDANSGGANPWIAASVVIFTTLASIWGTNLTKRLPILLGVIFGYVLYVIVWKAGGNVKPIDYTTLVQYPWGGAPTLTSPTYSGSAIATMFPVVIVLIAENLGHIKAIGAMTGQNLDPYIGRSLLGDALACTIAAAAGSTGVTTYAENMGTMGATRVYSTIIFPFAALVAIILAFIPKLGALVQTIPQPVIGGIEMVLFGLIAALGGRIWVEGNVDFKQQRNLISVGTALILCLGMAISNVTIVFGVVQFSNIGAGTIAIVVLHQLTRSPQEWKELIEDLKAGRRPRELWVPEEHFVKPKSEETQVLVV